VRVTDERGEHDASGLLVRNGYRRMEIVVHMALWDEIGKRLSHCSYVAHITHCWEFWLFIDQFEAFIIHSIDKGRLGSFFFRNPSSATFKWLGNARIYL